MAKLGDLQRHTRRKCAKSLTKIGVGKSMNIIKYTVDNVITINVPLFKKLQDIIFLLQDNHFMSHFKGHFEGSKS